MKIVNDYHFVLHKEAQGIVDKAGEDNWEYCFVGNKFDGCWPTINLSTYVPYYTLLMVETSPKYLHQTVLSPEPVIEVRYSHPLLTIEQIGKLHKVLKG